MQMLQSPVRVQRRLPSHLGVAEDRVGRSGCHLDREEVLSLAALLHLKLRICIAATEDQCPSCQRNGAAIPSLSGSCWQILHSQRIKATEGKAGWVGMGVSGQAQRTSQSTGLTVPGLSIVLIIVAHRVDAHKRRCRVLLLAAVG